MVAGTATEDVFFSIVGGMKLRMKCWSVIELVPSMVVNGYLYLPKNSWNDRSLYTYGVCADTDSVRQGSARRSVVSSRILPIFTGAPAITIV